MAKKNPAQLKNNTYTIRVDGSGGEIVLGRIDKKIYDYFEKRGIDLEGFIEDGDNELKIPESKIPFERDSWYDCDELAHENGAEMSDASDLTVKGADGAIVFTCALDIEALRNAGIKVEEAGSVRKEDQPKGTVVYCGQSTSKGCFFGGELTIDGVFDLTKLSLSYETVDGWKLLSFVMYDGNDVENYDLNTWGKGDYHSFTVIGEEAGDQVEPGECYHPEDSDFTPYHQFSEVKPVYEGSYNCWWKDADGYGSANGWLHWNGTNFTETALEKERVIDVAEWRGLNWDTVSARK